MIEFNTTAGIGLTNDGVEINSYKGAIVNFGKLINIRIDTNGIGYKIPNTNIETIPPISVDGVFYYDKIKIYGYLLSIDITKIPPEQLTGCSERPYLAITRNITDYTGIGMDVLVNYTVDGNIIGFDIKNPGKYYTEIPIIKLYRSKTEITPYIIPRAAINMIGSVGVNTTFTSEQLNDETFNPLDIKEFTIINNEIYENIPTIELVTGIGASGTVNLFNNQISSVTINSPGTNYINPPMVVFKDDIGTGAIGIANVVNNKIISVSIINGGENYSIYTTVEFVNFTAPAQFSGVIEQWTYNLGVNPYIDNIGGYVYNFEDTFCEPINVPDTVNYPQYLQIRIIEPTIIEEINPNPTVYTIVNPEINPNPTVYSIDNTPEQG